MSETPLSDAITVLLHDNNARNFAAFVQMFRHSEVGVIAHSLPKDLKPGARFRALGNETLGVVRTPDGRLMVKACADPIVSASRYQNANVSALICGADILKMVVASQDIEGVLVCSAASFHSVPIDRAAAAEFVHATPAPKTSRPWWKFW